MGAIVVLEIGAGDCTDGGDGFVHRFGYERADQQRCSNRNACCVNHGRAD